MKQKVFIPKFVGIEKERLGGKESIVPAGGDRAGIVMILEVFEVED